MSFLNRIANRPSYRITSSVCTLQPLVNRDVQTVKRWFEDKNLIQFAFGVTAGDNVLNRIARDYLHNFFSSSTEILGIWVQDKLVGFVNYTITRYREMTGRIGILLGSEGDRSHGLGTHAMNIALLYLFDRRGLDRIDLDTANFNTRAQRCFEKCGFRRIREITEMNFFSGELVHKVLMELYREDFFKDIHERFDALPTFEGHIPESRFVEKKMKES